MKRYKIGTVCLATDQGLGYLAKDFYNNGLIDKVYVQPHSSRENHYDWYPDRLTRIEELLKCDTLLFFETPFDWSFFLKARNKGIRTVIMVMYECSNLRYIPDIVISPSLLDKQYYPDSIFIPVPVDVKWRLREKAHTFILNAGNGGLGARNGINELHRAMRYVKNPIKLIIRSQVPIEQVKDNRIEYRIGHFDDIWSEGDVFIFPEKFNGLSLPLQEAFASGMLIMCGDRFPMNTWLSKEPLIPVSGYKKERISVEFDSAIIRPEDIAKTIDYWYDKDITSYSLQGKIWAEQNSWKVLKEKYEQILKPL